MSVDNKKTLDIQEVITLLTIDTQELYGKERGKQYDILWEE